MYILVKEEIDHFLLEFSNTCIMVDLKTINFRRNNLFVTPYNNLRFSLNVLCVHAYVQSNRNTPLEDTI